MAEAAAIAVLTAAATHVTKSMIDDFRKNYTGEEVWECWPDEAVRNIQLIEGERKNDEFPQGKDYIKQLLGYAYTKRIKFFVKGVKKFPHWIWYYELSK